MADSQEARGYNETIERCEYFQGVRHTGNRASLIAAELARLEQFPGEPGCGKTSTVFPAEGERRKFRVSRRSTYIYEVTIYWNPEERAAYEQRWAAECAKQCRQHETEARRALAGPADVRAMADSWFKNATLALIHAFNMANNPNIPFTYDKATLEQVTEHCRALMALQMSGGFKPKLAAMAQGDGEFQRFMGRVVGDGGAGQGPSAAG
jgi:hypothetical protein